MKKQQPFKLTKQWKQLRKGIVIKDGDRFKTAAGWLLATPWPGHTAGDCNYIDGTPFIYIRKIS
jgi:glyoxylase-like metal-dependent hydrolase (beta-lactamase superfamily II)